MCKFNVSASACEGKNETMQSFEALSCNQKDKQKKMKNLSMDALVKNGGGFN